MANNSAKAVRVARPTIKIDKSVRISRNGMSSAMFITLIAFLIAGVFLGGFSMYSLTKNDCFELLPATNQEIDLVIGAEEDFKDYDEFWVKCVAFGKDVSASVEVKFYYREDINHDPQIVEKINPEIAGDYYVVYTSSNFKYKNVQLIRNVQVVRAEE